MSGLRECGAAGDRAYPFWTPEQSDRMRAEARKCGSLITS